jgi:hypothetical protein
MHICTKCERCFTFASKLGEHLSRKKGCPIKTINPKETPSVVDTESVDKILTTC